MPQGFIDDDAGSRHRPITERRIMPGLQGVAAAGAKPTLMPPDGFRYHGFYIDYAATTLALASVRTDVVVNGKPIQSFTWDQRDSWNQHDKLPIAAANTGVMYIPFERVGLEDLRDRYISCINYGANSAGLQSPGGINDFRLNFYFDNNPVAITKFDIYAVVSGINPEQSIYLPWMETWTEPVATSANGTVNTFQRRLALAKDNNRQVLTRLWLQDTAAHITNLRIEENGVAVHESIPTAITNSEAQAYGVRSPQSGWQVWDGAMKGEGDRVIDVFNTNSLKVQFTAVTGANSPLTVVTECLGPCST